MFQNRKVPNYKREHHGIVLWDLQVVAQSHNTYLVSLPVQLTEKGDRQIRIHVITICEVDLIKMSSQMNVNIKHIHYHDCYSKKIRYSILMWSSSIFSNMKVIMWRVRGYVLVLYCLIFSIFIYVITIYSFSPSF
ncbi:hypothetical protein VCUG_01381 [Vavraia culicis subsp. floridensis]|uniref:Uncharacterized protein n=1 Tax=Vavraia culicis (isolate floridensis) TaxID=948595 RepID=L2GUX0_VAVCU|nr:uncharacterized protein VCUG_01381 [Vavraia culicis subsp. floridensis]ELA47108.1 hypothetical protein VCUG_01381 [Vavraia culicis subsp. floridensis]